MRLLFQVQRAGLFKPLSQGADKEAPHQRRKLYILLHGALRCVCVSARAFAWVRVAFVWWCLVKRFQLDTVVCAFLEVA